MVKPTGRVKPTGSFVGTSPLDSGHRSDLNRKVLRNMAGALSVKECGKTLPPLFGQQFMLEIRKGISWRKSLQQKGAGESSPIRKCLTRVIKNKKT
jgi:hypothetical protein